MSVSSLEELRAKAVEAINGLSDQIEELSGDPAKLLHLSEKLRTVASDLEARADNVAGIPIEPPEHIPVQPPVDPPEPEPDEEDPTDAVVAPIEEAEEVEETERSWLTSAEIAKVSTIAAESRIASYSWKNRGVAPKGYTKGLAVSFATMLRKHDAKISAALEMAQKKKSDANKDVLAWYASEFQSLGLDNSRDGVDTLRGLFALMLGLGMRESSGRYAEGRDMSAQNVTSNTCEAGLYQQSWDSHPCSKELPRLLHGFSAIGGEFYLGIYKEGVKGPDSSDVSYGSGDGRKYQDLAKSNPQFAVECAAIGLRSLRRHWGPIGRKECELRADANVMLKLVQEYILGVPSGITPPPPKPLTISSFTADGSVFGIGDKGYVVELIQAMLVVDGASLDVDGDFGKITLSATKAFQARNNLEVDGWVGPKTAAALDSKGNPEDVITRPPSSSPSVKKSAPWLSELRAITGTKEIPGSANSPVIMAWRNDISSAFPDTASYNKNYTGDSIPWCGFGLAGCFARCDTPIKPPFGPRDTDRYMWAELVEYAELGSEIGQAYRRCRLHLHTIRRWSRRGLREIR